MKLSILIPTYNRCDDLLRNLTLLEKYIVDGDLVDLVNVVVSNNASTDATREKVIEWQKTCKINFIFLDDHKHNIGLEANALYVLQKAESEYIMYLGDDDYLSEDYIQRVLEELQAHPTLGCIIPNDYWCSPNGTIVGERGKCENSYMVAGFEACNRYSYLGHQLSGLVFRREGLYDAYISHKVHNIYPFIFFVAYTALRYDVMHMADNYVRVTQVPQTKKDWGYGNDGLVNDIFDNFKCLGVPYRQRAQLESHFLKVDPRYLWATNDTKRCIAHILKGSNVSYLGRYYIFRDILRGHYFSGSKVRFALSILARILNIK